MNGNASSEFINVLGVASSRTSAISSSGTRLDGDDAVLGLPLGVIRHSPVGKAWLRQPEAEGVRPENEKARTKRARGWWSALERAKHDKNARASGVSRSAGNSSARTGAGCLCPVPNPCHRFGLRDGIPTGTTLRSEAPPSHQKDSVHSSIGRCRCPARGHWVPARNGARSSRLQEEFCHHRTDPAIRRVFVIALVPVCLMEKSGNL